MVIQYQTYSNYGKIGHAKQTCHNRKMKKTIITIVPTKVAKPIVEVIAPHVKPTTIPLQYPCIIYYSVEHCAPYCFKQIKVQNMFHSKTNFVIIVVPKPLKLDNVPINVVTIVTTCSQVLEQ
jgi:hypothetical protein